MVRLFLILLLLGFLPSTSQADDPIVAKGKITIGSHKVNMKKGEIYQIIVEGKGFSPYVNISRGFLTNSASFQERNIFRSSFIPNSTMDYEIQIVPNTFNLRGTGPFEYSMTVNPIAVAKEPILKVEGEWNGKDPLYIPERRSFFKGHPLKMKAGQYYVIDLMTRGPKSVDTYLYLEDGNKKILIRDDDGGEGLNSRIIFQPRQDGAFNIIATTLGQSTGQYSLIVRTEEKK